MGRKIPAKKHRGVKDPLEQQARRLQSIKGKINAPPKDPDDQPVPRSLTRLFAFQNNPIDIKKKKSKLKRKLPKDIQHAPGVSENPVAKLKRLPGESGRGFSLRINSAMRALHDPLPEEHCPEDLEAEDVKGERMAAQRARRRRGARERPEKLTRAQKLTLKKKAKKEKAAEEEARPEVAVERVAFGEVAHAPPALPVRPRRAPPAPRAGRRDLLLNAMLGGAVGGAKGGAKTSVAGSADAQRRERARLDAVAAYRLLKRHAREQTQRATGNRTRR